MRRDERTALTTVQIRESSERGCTFCSLLLKGLELFELHNSPIRFYVGARNDGWEIKPVDEEEYLGKNIERLQFHIPGATIYLPITSTTIERVFVEYSAPESLRHVLSLVEGCNERHECLNERRKLPKRVVDVGLEGEEMLKLYCPWAGEEGSYCALSHCWGGAASFITTSENLGQRQKGFGFGELPQGFKDAVVVCRALGTRFLWIDSICIVQGDR